jgi:predicted nucleic acid-binding protein
MRVVFADTSYWFALVFPRDHLHSIALDAVHQLGQHRVVTSEMVVTEFLNSVSGAGRHHRDFAIGLVDAILGDARVLMVPSTPDLFRSSFTLYRDRPDKSWSLTDCASFVIMDERGIKEALTHDRHFEQQGYRALLRT